MLIPSEHGPVKGFRLARSLAGRAYYYTACWWLDGCLIDSGCAFTAPELAAALADLDLHTVAITHSHEDHVGANRLLAERRGARVLAPEKSLAVLAGKSPRPRLMPYQRVLWGWPALQEAQPLPEVMETERHRLRVIPTPGHSPDHVCFFEEQEGWLFVGDAYVSGRERSLRRGYDIWGIMASLKKMAALEPALLFTGSGSLVKDPTRAMADKLEYLEEKATLAREYYLRGFNVKQIRRILFGRQQSIHYITMGDFSGENLVLSLLQGPPPTS